MLRNRRICLSRPLFWDLKPIQTAPLASTLDHGTLTSTPNTHFSGQQNVGRGKAIDPPFATRNTTQINNGILKLVSEDGEFLGESILKLLSDQTDYSVIGVLGCQGVGKSTIMSQIAGQVVSKSQENSDVGHIFPVATPEYSYLSMHKTTGIDLYLATDRRIILDVQPLFSPSVIAQALKVEGRSKRLNSSLLAEESLIDHQSFEYAAFVLSICHTVIIVQDWIADIQFLQAIRSALMFRHIIRHMELPADVPPQEDTELVFVFTKMEEEELSKEQMSCTQKVVESIFGSKRRGDTLDEERNNHFSKEKCSINLFFLPLDDGVIENNNKSTRSTSNLLGFSYQVAMEKLSNFVMETKKIASRPVAEREWLRIAGKLWEGIRVSPLLHEFLQGFNMRDT